MNRTMLNKVLMLRMLELSRNIPSYHKITQLVYILQEEGRKERRTTFNYAFTKWHYEPYSQELEKDLQKLNEEGLVLKKETIQLTEKGKAVTQKMISFYEKEKVDSFFRFFAFLHLKETLHETSTYINRKYEIAKYPTDALIAEICYEKQSMEEDILHLKEEIDKRFDELETEEMETMRKAKKIMSDEAAN